METPSPQTPRLTPQLADAPGLKWRRRATGFVPYWVARPAAIAAGYPVKTVSLDGLAIELVAGRCRRLQQEMVDWLSGRANNDPRYDGTIGSVIEIYERHPDSSFRRLKPSSRHPYTVYLRKLKQSFGDTRIDIVTGLDVMRWHEAWRAPAEPGGKPLLGAAAMTLSVLKAALTFGVVCGLPGCKDLHDVLHMLRLPSPPPRQQAPTAADVERIRSAAHRLGLPSFALATAIQFEGVVRQWDVIGRWVPIGDPAPSIVLRGTVKWLGPTWADVDKRMVLSLTPSKTERTTAVRTVVDFSLCPMILEEIAAMAPERRHGPLIVRERTGEPWEAKAFNSAWQRIRREAGLPASLWNRDLRAGAVTEGSKAGARLEDSAKQAGHKNSRTTARVYDRDTLEASRRVAQARIDWRKNEP